MNMFKSTFQPAPAPAANIHSINGFASSTSSAPRQEDPFYATSFLDEPICEPNAPLLRLALKSRAENKPQNLIPLEDFVTPQPGRVFRRTDGEVIGGMPPDTPLRGYGSTMEEIDEEEEEEAFELSTFIEEYQQEFNLEEYQEEFNEESYFDLSAPADEDDESFGKSMDLDQTPPVASTSILPPDLHAPRATTSAVKPVHRVHASTSPPSPARLSKRSTPVPMAKATDSSPKNRRTSSPSPTESVRSGSGSGESGGDLGDFSQVFQYLNQEKEKSLAFQAELSGSGSDKKSPGGTMGGESASSSSRKSTSTTTTRHKKKNRRSRSQDDYVGASTDTDFLPPTRTILKSQSRPSLRRQVLSTPGQPIRGSGTPDSPFDLVTPPPKARRRSRLSKELGSVQEKRVDWLSGDFSMAEGEDEHRSSLEKSWAPLPPSLPKTSPAKPPAPSPLRGPLIDLTGDSDADVSMEADDSFSRRKVPEKRTEDDNAEQDMDISLDDRAAMDASTSFDERRPFSSTTFSSDPTHSRPFSTTTVPTPFSSHNFSISFQTPLTTPDVSGREPITTADSYAAFPAPVKHPVRKKEPEKMSEVEAHAMYLLDRGMEVLDVAKELMKLGIKDLNRAGVDLAALDEKVRESKRQKSLVDINSSEKSTSKKGVRAADTIVIPDSPPAEQASLKIQRIGYQETALGITAQPQPASKEKEKVKETVKTVRRNDDADEIRDKFPLPPSEKIKFILQRVKQQFPQDFRRMKNYMVMFDVPKHVARKERERSKQFHQGLIRLTGPKEMPTGPPNEHAVKGLWTSRTKGFLNIEQEKKVRELLRAGHKLDSDEVREVSTMEEQDHIEIFIDNSNIYLSFLKYIKFAERAAGRSVFSDQVRAQGEFMGRRPKLDYAMLFSILERGRKARAKCIVGSSPLPQSLEVAVEWGYEVSLLQRVQKAVNVQAIIPDDDILDPSRRRRGVKRLRTRQTSGGPRYTEQGVDEILRMKLLESLAVERSPNAKVTIVLVSGDGAASDFSDEGFMTPIRAALKKGWNVEIVAFGMCTSAAWFDKKVTKLGTGTLNIIEMEEWAEALIS